MHKIGYRGRTENKNTEKNICTEQKGTNQKTKEEKTKKEIAIGRTIDRYFYIFVLSFDK